jgi:two-component system, OmpR family, sensor histidine kinase KdpD
MDIDAETRGLGAGMRSRTWVAPRPAAGLLIDDATRHTEQIGQVTAEADRMRTVLLAAVGHDLRSPLAAARAAVSRLRSPGLQLTEADQDELLATAEESLELLAQLATRLLDITRLQAGGPSVLRRPADLSEIIGCALASLGPQGRTVQVDLSPDLPGVLADPPGLERVIANVTANALRYAPPGTPPLLGRVL